MRNNQGICLLAAVAMWAGVGGAFAQDKGIDALNARIKAAHGQWTAGATSMSGLSDDEFKARLLSPEDMVASAKTASSLHKLPLQEGGTKDESFNWAQKGIVTPVRDQGKCGSCWAFSMSGAEELQLLMKKPEIYGKPGAEAIRSPQALVSCETKMKGCKGGNLNASYLVENGLPAESVYPYTSGDGSQKGCGEGAAPGWQAKTEKIDDWGQVNGDVGAIKSALTQYGPIPSSMMVFDDFKSYKSGVYSQTPGSKFLGGHAILVVGFDDGSQSLIVKNSWTTGWGEGGYFRIAYSEVQCDMADMLFGHTKVNFGCATIGYNMKGGPSLSSGDKPVVSQESAQKALKLLTAPLL